MASTDTLPDDVLLPIFNFYVYHEESDTESETAWQTLVHVCHRWRIIVFGSPRYLNLQLVCTPRTRARDMLDVWPAFPLNIWCDSTGTLGSVDNVIAALERDDRVCKIIVVNVRRLVFETLFLAMQQPFSELTHLTLWSTDEMVPVVPDSFLGGSVPRLEYLRLDGIRFPGLPNLLLSATHLATLYLENIPHSGYIAPDVMVVALSTLTRLETLLLTFKSPRSYPHLAGRCPPPSTRSVLPVFTLLRFKGASEYLEDLVACIDTPQLFILDIAFFNDIIFDTPQLVQFISRIPKSRTLETAHIAIRDDGARVYFSSPMSDYGELNVGILCKGLDWQLSSLGQVCASCLPLFSTLEDLYIREYSRSQLDRKDGFENGLWLELLQPFTTIKNLYLAEKVVPLIVPALQELVESRTTEILPTLQNIYSGGPESSGPVQEGIKQFVAARRVAGHPIAASHWSPEQDKI